MPPIRGRLTDLCVLRKAPVFGGKNFVSREITAQLVRLCSARRDPIACEILRIPPRIAFKSVAAPLQRRQDASGDAGWARAPTYVDELAGGLAISLLVLGQRGRGTVAPYLTASWFTSRMMCLSMSGSLR